MLQGSNVHIALERVLGFRVTALFNHQVDGLRALRFDIGTGGIEMRVVRYRVGFVGNQCKQDAFGGAALVGRNQVPEWHQVFHRRFETVIRRAAGIGFIAHHQCAPLPGAHAGGARIGQQVDQHIVRVQGEQVV